MLLYLLSSTIEISLVAIKFRLCAQQVIIGGKNILSLFDSSRPGFVSTVLTLTISRLEHSSSVSPLELLTSSSSLKLPAVVESY